ncbi:EF-hand domain-containing protein [Aliiroseovarius sp.]|uniref:EF-hand domain-containing protein n=1 Tax=Aliiroseovarius sp. TaxID=1872442 RepID=UPI003BA9C7CD
MRISPLTFSVTLGLITALPAQAAPRALAKFDLNKDGQVTVGEFISVRTARFDEVDANGDGALTPAEYAKLADGARIARRGGGQAPEPRDVFDRIGHNGDGKIARTEYAEAIEAIAQGLDVDGNGILTRSDLKTLRDKR